MRDPEHIDRVLAALKSAWLANPGLSLCQLIDEASVLVSTSASAYSYLEDDAIERGLRALGGKTA